MNSLEETIDIFKDIVGSCDVSEIPTRYISALSYRDQNGHETVLDDVGDFNKILNRHHPYGNVDRREISVMLDIRTLSIDVMIALTETLSAMRDNRG